jgi:CMP-N,N'-diacetyllegionaminic acid synthase
MSAADHHVLGIIPARGGSKGIPRKNLKLLCGKPLIVWTIEAAQRATGIERLVVSTDDIEIAETAVASGAEVIMRPAELAADASPTEPALEHVLDTLQTTEGYVPEAIALLQCTSPLRGSDIIDAGIEMLFETGGDAILSVCPIQHWYLAGMLSPEGAFLPEYDYSNRPFSQTMPHKYRENGALFVTRTSSFRRTNNRLGGEVFALVMDAARSVDIDTDDDFILAAQVMAGIRPV